MGHAGTIALRAAHGLGAGLLLALLVARARAYPATRLKVVLNRATLRTGLRAEEIDEVLSQPIAWRLPDEPSVVQSLPAGQPLVLASRMARKPPHQSSRPGPM